MVMGRRPGVATASWPITTADLAGMAGQLAIAMARVPMRSPLSGEGNALHNVGVAVTRETIRSFMGYCSSLPIDEFRSIEVVLDDLCAVVMPPLAKSLGVDTEKSSVGGVPGVWYRPSKGKPRGTVLYLHGGGYIGTSPRMYAFFVATLARRIDCEIFVSDYRLAPEFPFPAALEDAAIVMEALLHGDADPGRFFLAGDSGGGGLVTTLIFATQHAHVRSIGGALLFSPEVDLVLDEPSVSANAKTDILPWNIPTTAYLHGRDPASASVSAVNQDVSHWPATFVAWGAEELFRDPIRRFAAHLESASVQTVACEQPGMFHVFPILMPWAEASRRVIEELAEFVDKRLAAAEPA
jgi:acetyl esterase/lipase